MVFELVVIVLLIGANGIFSGAEIAVIALRRTRLQQLVKAGQGRARAVQWLRDNPERFLATVQIGITVISATAAAFGGASLAVRLEEPLREAGFTRSAPQLALAGVVGLVSFLSIVLGELVPKSLALRHAEGYALWTGRALKALSTLMRPLVWLLTGASNLVLRIFSDKTTFTEARLSPEELRHLVEEASRAGALHPQTGDIASRALDLGGRTVDEVMVPRTSVVALERDSSPEEIRLALAKEGHSRLPVYQERLDQVVGYVLAKDLLVQLLEEGRVSLQALLRPGYFVPEGALALDVLRAMQGKRILMGMVVDEAGGLAGIVTMEDLVEELVGEIFSEDEKVPQPIRLGPDGSALVQASLPIREVNRALGLKLPETEEATTLGGLCIWLATTLPAPGARFTLEDSTVLEVVEASARRVKLVRVYPPAVKS